MNHCVLFRPFTQKPKHGGYSVKKPIGYKILWWFGKIFGYLLYGLEVTGTENIPKHGGIILAANHQSYLDSPLVAQATDRMIRFIALEFTSKIPVIGWLVRHSGVISIKGDGATIPEMRVFLKETRNLLDDGQCLLIYPEGSTGGTIRAGQKGIGLISHNYPVIPIRIRGNEKECYRKSLWILWPHRITIHIGKPIIFEPHTRAQDRVSIIMEAIIVL